MLCVFVAMQNFFSPHRPLLNSLSIVQRWCRERFVGGGQRSTLYLSFLLSLLLTSSVFLRFFAVCVCATLLCGQVCVCVCLCLFPLLPIPSFHHLFAHWGLADAPLLLASHPLSLLLPPPQTLPQLRITLTKPTVSGLVSPKDR